MAQPIRSYQDIIAWQKAMDLVDLVHRESRRLPTDERSGLTSQLRRSAVSVPSNIAEGWGRGPSKDCKRFLIIARSSLYELTTQAMMCERIGFDGNWQRIVADADEVRRTLHRLITASP
ncbi:MAG: four helix bundle protein [Planctomycetota bacterium]